MAEIKVDVMGETCPIPLVEARKALRKAEKGDRIIIKGSHPASYKEIPMAAKALEVTLVSREGDSNDWVITLEK